MENSKKQLQPLIERYGIDTETDYLFTSIIELFDGRPNYQYWAISMVYGKKATYKEIKAIRDWAFSNKTLIKQLYLHNITAYTTKSELVQLRNEISSLKITSLIKSAINKFNTDQRKMLTSKIFPNGINTLTDYANRDINNWYSLFVKFNSLPESRRNNLLSNASSIREIDALRRAIKDCLIWKYKWNKDSMLEFLYENASDCEVVFNEGQCVIVRVPSYESAVRLAGGGRTKWCITKEEEHFETFVGKDSTQYFIFDFSRKESDCFAHIAFTVERGEGIVFAQTCDNKSMMYDFSNGVETYNINSLLNKFGVSKSIFVTDPSKRIFKWDEKSITSTLSNLITDCSIIHSENGVLIVETSNIDIVKILIGHTFIKYSHCDTKLESKVYIRFDTRLPYNDCMAVTVMLFVKNVEGNYVLFNAHNTFDERVEESKLEEILSIIRKKEIENGTDK